MSFRIPLLPARAITNLAICLSIFLAASTAYSQAKPDLKVTITPPPLTPVYSTGTYTVEVANIGNKDAAGVQLTIQLPKTATSPQIYIMGNLTSFTTPTLALAGATGTDAGTRLVGSLGTIKRNKKRVVSFSIQFPEKTGALVITANASTTTAPEHDYLNNDDSETAVLSYYANTMPLDVDIENQHCTGRNLTAFFECTKFPGSCSSHISRFHDNGFGIRTISFPDYPDYWGVWNITGDVLTFSYYDSTGENVANFSGRGVPGGYFEGLTTFPGDTTYVSPYRVGLP